MMRLSLIFFLHFAVCLPFILLFWNHGHHQTDDGYILAYSWRIWSGQIPYADFLFDKPPLSPILHAAWFFLGESRAFNAARIGYYVQMALISSCWSIWAVKRRWLNPSLPTLTILAIFTLLSLHTFPPMPWYTVDSVMFSSIGIVAFLFTLTPTTPRNFLLLRISSGLLVGASALCKQNFLGIHAAWILFCVIDCILARRREPGKLQSSWLNCVCTIITSLLPLACTSLWVFKATAIGLENISHFCTTSALLDSGWFDYLRAFPASALYLVLGTVLGSINSWNRRIDWLPLMLIITGVSVLFGNMSNVVDGINSGHSIFFWGLGILIGRLANNVFHQKPYAWDEIVFYFFAFAIPWSASISQGWKTPLLGIASLSPLFAATVNSFSKSSHSTPTKVLSILSLVGLSITFLHFHTQSAYRDVPRPAQTYNISNIYPRFGSLYVGKIVYSQYSELKQISTQVRTSNNSEIIILGEHPLFSFLENRLNPTSLDWYYPTLYYGEIGRILDELRKKMPVVIVPVVENELECRPSVLAEPITSWVQQTGKMFYRTPSFCAYHLAS